MPSFNDKTLHVAVAYVNPLRSRNRESLMKEFMTRYENTPNLKLYIGEIAFGDRDFAVTDANNPLHFRFRTKANLWHKERLLNLIIQRFPADWEYGGYYDGDFQASRLDWPLEGLHTLQHAHWSQLFSSLQDVSNNHHPFRPMPGFAYNFVKNGYRSIPGYTLPFHKATFRGEYRTALLANGKRAFAGATGGGWAFTRHGFEACGGLLDTCILGSADWHMSFGLIGQPDTGHPDLRYCGKGYVESIVRWQQRAGNAVQGHISYVANNATHFWHGKRSSRGYSWRWEILKEFDFNPLTDIHPDAQGLWQFSGNKPQMEHAFKMYCASRNEDEPYFGEGLLA